ncbi:hypothetical protein [Sphingosinicella sp. BN140058]|uniref:hypothetical protein n=1 Tax=Sphingosinicella sp. BN140058 TaxID=1892855 RepID=UPI001013A34B|nr:hypothetical protein [Sphingosinicella sp. BN140058]QAY75151.1 hypothetical protein ETR14_00355 [Sphingosinicella sp. BN140058]
MRAILLLLVISACAPVAELREAHQRGDVAATGPADALTARLFDEIARTLHPLGDNRRSLAAEIPMLHFVSDGRPSAEPGLCEADHVLVDLQPRATAARLRVKQLSASPVYFAPSLPRFIAQPRRGLTSREAEADAAICNSTDPRRHNLLSAPSATLAARSIREIARLVEAVRAAKPPENLLCGAFAVDQVSDSRASCLQAIAALTPVDLIKIDLCADTPPGTCLIASNQVVAIRFDVPEPSLSPRRVTVGPVTEGIIVTRSGFPKGTLRGLTGTGAKTLK